MSTTDKAQVIVQLSQRIDTIEDAQKRISDKLDNFIGTHFILFAKYLLNSIAKLKFLT